MIARASRRLAASRISPAALAVACSAFLPGGAAAQAPRPQAAVVPEAITVGDIFHAAIRLDLPPGTRLEAPDTLAVPEDVEAAGRREIRLDSADGGRTVTVTWPLTAWRPGAYELPPVTVRLARDDGTAAPALSVNLPSFEVRSVLPADTAGVEPQPAKDVLGANRVWWPLLLALLLALAAALAFYLWWRRRRPKVAPVVQPLVLPRTAALEELEALRHAGLLEAGAVKPFYERLTEIIRRYAAALDPSWSTDLTTSELGGRLRARLPAGDALHLLRILGAGDLVKFARSRPPAATALADLDAARAWIERVGAGGPADTPAEQVAA
jgi:hypothetical protein